MNDLIYKQDAIDAIDNESRVTDNKRDLSGLYLAKYIIETLPSAEPQWIPVSERLPKECEYIDNVCKYYLIQDEYGDMHVAHLCRRGWEPIESTKALGCDVVAWMELPESYEGDDEHE